MSKECRIQKFTNLSSSSSSTLASTPKSDVLVAKFFGASSSSWASASVETPIAAASSANSSSLSIRLDQYQLGKLVDNVNYKVITSSRLSFYFLLSSCPCL